MRRSQRGAVIAVSLFFLTISCTTTKLTKTWTDDAYRGSRLTDVMVIGVTEDNTTRRSFENRFVKKLKATGIQAVSSAAALPSETKLDKEKIVAEIKRRGVNAVLVTHLVEVEEEEMSSPQTTHARPDDYHGGYVEAYAAAYDSVHHPEYTVKVKVRLETKLYDAKTDTLIWSAESTTIQAGSDAKAMDSVIDALIRDLRKNKLLP